MTQYNKRYILSTFEKIEICALSNKRFNKLSGDTKFIKIEVIPLKIQVLQSVKFLLFFLYFTHCFVHYLRINQANKMSLSLNRVTYLHIQTLADTHCTLWNALLITAAVHFQKLKYSFVRTPFYSFRQEKLKKGKPWQTDTKLGYQSLFTNVSCITNKPHGYCRKFQTILPQLFQRVMRSSSTCDK